jgi:uncharacterized membrane protein YraQ (UPF0718 family)
MRRMDASSIILAALVVAALAFAAWRDARLPIAGLEASARLLRGVWLDLALGFLFAGLMDVLIPAPALSRWLGEERPGRGIVVGWVVGLVLPGGPYLVFPAVATLYRKGAAPGPLISLLTAKTLVSPIRMLTYEAPLLGWPLTLARFIPGVLLPPVMGLVGQRLYVLLGGAR